MPPTSRPAYRYFTATTLDGFLADEHDSLDWLLSQPTGTDSIFSYDRFIADIGAIVVGRTRGRRDGYLDRRRRRSGCGVRPGGHAR